MGDEPTSTPEAHSPVSFWSFVKHRWIVMWKFIVLLFTEMAVFCVWIFTSYVGHRFGHWLEAQGVNESTAQTFILLSHYGILTIAVIYLLVDILRELRELFRECRGLWQDFGQSPD